MAGQNSKYSAEGLNGVFDQITLAAGAGLVYDSTKPNGTSLYGCPVKLSAYMTVIPCVADDANIYGALIRLEKDGTAIVGKGNVQEFKGDVVAGSKVVAAGSGAVKAGAADAGVGRVIDKDSARGIVWVDLG